MTNDFLQKTIILFILRVNEFFRKEIFSSTDFMNLSLELHHIIEESLDKMFITRDVLKSFAKLYLHCLIDLWRIKFRRSCVKILGGLFALISEILKQELRFSDKFVTHCSIIKSSPIFSNEHNQSFKTIRQSSFLITFIAYFNSVDKVD